MKVSIQMDRKLTGRLTLMIVLLLFITGCTSHKKLTDDPLTFSGDISIWASIQDIESELEMSKVKYNEDTVDGYLLDDCISQFSPIVESYNVYIKADDGFMVKLEGNTIKGTYIAYIDGQGWSYISDKHPVNSGVKNITDIIIVTDSMSLKSEDKLIDGSDPDDYGLSIIINSRNLYYTKGELLMLNNKQYIIEDGQSSFDGISIEVLKQKQGVTLSTLVDAQFSKLLVYTFNGEEFYDYNVDGSIEVTSDQINYMSGDLETQKLSIVGIMINPVGTSVTNNYYDVQYFLDKDIRVISVLLDGFSYAQLEYIRMNNKNLTLSNQEQVKKAKTVYKPVTNAGFAAMLTGVEPIKSGILDRSFRELKVDSIFDFCQENSKSHVLIEGDINILNVNTTTLLNLDKDENGFTDNEIMTRVRDIKGENYDYTFIHFHSIDEFGHKFGPLASETINQITVIDEYVAELIAGFDGKIIISADHGMHQVDDHGDHGDFRFEDMFVPYMIIDGGLYE